MGEERDENLAKSSMREEAMTKKKRAKLAELDRRKVVGVFKRLKRQKVSVPEAALELGCSTSLVYYHIHAETYVPKQKEAT